MNTVVKTILSGDGARKVEIFRRRNGTFGFQELVWVEEGAWVPKGRYAVSFTESAEGAEREATERVTWLADQTAADA